MEKLLAEIYDHLKWYSGLGSEASIDELLDRRDKLAVLSYGLAQEAGNRFIEYNGFYFIRAIHVAKAINAMVKDGLAVNKAENEAKEQNEEILQQEKDAEGQSFLADKLLKQVNAVLNAMNQRISYLKQEKQQTVTYQDQP